MAGSRGHHRIGIVAGKPSRLYGGSENCFRMRIPRVGSRHHPSTGKGIPPAYRKRLTAGAALPQCVYEPPRQYRHQECRIKTRRSTAASRHRSGEGAAVGREIDITNEQLSSLSDISPFTASRLLSKWERDGKLSKQRGRGHPARSRIPHDCLRPEGFCLSRGSQNTLLFSSVEFILSSLRQRNDSF
jgi:hypothetical protein